VIIAKRRASSLSLDPADVEPPLAVS
jgi:hypothetical protein